MKQKASPSTTAGDRAEQAAAQFLQQQGFCLVTQNYHYRGGEIDLILQQNHQLLIFVEVRLRNNPKFGSGADSVTPQKQQRISRTALHYLQHHPQYEHYEIRFDVISATEQNGAFQLDWIKEAFWPGDD